MTKSGESCPGCAYQFDFRIACIELCASVVQSVLLLGSGRFTILGMQTSGQADSQQKSAGQFATTHWSLVLAAGDRENEDSNRALEKLCRAYWAPLYAYVRRRVSNIHEAQDLTQAFFERLLGKRYLAEADPQRGRFRAFLITAFKHFLSKKWDKALVPRSGMSKPSLLCHAFLLVGTGCLFHPRNEFLFLDVFL